MWEILEQAKRYMMNTSLSHESIRFISASFPTTVAASELRICFRISAEKLILICDCLTLVHLDCNTMSSAEELWGVSVFQCKDKVYV